MKIEFDVLLVKPDQRTYHNDSIHIVPVNDLRVRINVPDEFVLEEDGDKAVIALGGLRVIADQCELAFSENADKDWNDDYVQVDDDDDDPIEFE